MDQAHPDTAAIVRRVVRRTLTVLGGTIAGTAIAWAVSSASASASAETVVPSASASAETPCELPRLDAVPALTQVADTEIAQQVVTPVVGVGPGFSGPVSTLSDVVCAVGQVVPTSPITDLGHGARRTATEVGKSIAGQFGWVPTVPLDLSGLGRGDRPGADASGGGTHEPPSLVWPVGEQSAAAPTSSIAHGINPDRLAAGTATERALGDGLTRRGSPAPIAPGKPAPAPGAPATMPGTGSSGHNGGGADGPAFAALSQSGSHIGLRRGKAIAGSQVRVHGEQGAQPGVTPD